MCNFHYGSRYQGLDREVAFVRRASAILQVKAIGYLYDHFRSISESDLSDFWSVSKIGIRSKTDCCDRRHRPDHRRDAD